MDRHPLQRPQHRDRQTPLSYALLVLLAVLSAVWAYRSVGLDWMKITWPRATPAPVVELTPGEASQLRQHGILW